MLGPLPVSIDKKVSFEETVPLLWVFFHIRSIVRAYCVLIVGRCLRWEWDYKLVYSRWRE